MYRDVRENFAVYWHAYGGVRALVRSPYLHLALVLTAFAYPYWSAPLWWDTVISVLPNLLGFTLGGFAMFMGFGDEQFKRTLVATDPDAPDEPTLFVVVCGAFVHFIVMQCAALLAALLAKAWWVYVPWPEPIARALPWLNLLGGCVGFGLFLYALTSTLAATMHVFRMATVYDKVQRMRQQLEEAQERSRTGH
ncbi:hypothetical protein HQN59_13225 [Schlegelella sp. ID0723]|uniref:Uncharacterized protein n=2 Tax=Piscinibacter koreensis TaxID=2742824 RepID=A0A7Y6TX15_9BURK|nr:hypothetical protein [Schlegelella koreensis]NUZ06724.1 hypothetical protein [Schlegelella koreensis]